MKEKYKKNETICRDMSFQEGYTYISNFVRFYKADVWRITYSLYSENMKIISKVLPVETALPTLIN